MTRRPLVSTIIIFLNGDPFLEEAVASVFAQTYADWELLLVDDGSVDGSPAYARSVATRHPERVRYLTHPGRVNLGMSASRNLGLAHARGEYVALLDADDVWLPGKLEAQVEALERRPGAAMVYGAALYWRSWQGHASGSGDRLVLARVRPDRVYDPPFLVSRFLTGAAAVPCPSCILVRRELMQRIGGFEPEFRTQYEDQVFFAKVALHAPVLVRNDYWIKYRQHDASSTAIEGSAIFPDPARLRYLDWLERYLPGTGHASPALLRAIRRERWFQYHPWAGRLAVRLQGIGRRWRRRLMPWRPPDSIRVQAGA